MCTHPPKKQKKVSPYGYNIDCKMIYSLISSHRLLNEITVILQYCTTQSARCHDIKARVDDAHVLCCVMTETVCLFSHSTDI